MSEEKTNLRIEILEKISSLVTAGYSTAKVNTTPKRIFAMLGLLSV